MTRDPDPPLPDPVTIENIFVARLNELQLIEDTTWLRGDMKLSSSVQL